MHATIDSPRTFRAESPSLVELVVKTTVVHTVSYFVAGVLALHILDYAALYAQPDMAALMRQTTDPLVMAGPLFQPIRGLVFGLAFYPLREILLERKHAWLALWWILVALGIIAPFGAGSGSVEGLIYTRIPVAHQIVGLPETLTQSLLLAAGVVYWLKHPEKRWFTWAMTIAFAVILLLSLLGLLLTARAGAR